MTKAEFCFHGCLGDFFNASQKEHSIEVDLKGYETVKHLIEALGVPHTEIDLIVIGGSPVDFKYRVKGGEKIQIYPLGTDINIHPKPNLRPELNEEIKFVLDGHLGKLATYLRLLGFDVIYENDANDRKLAEISCRDERVLLTRDRGLLMRSIVVHGYWVRSKSPRQQLTEVIQRYSLVQHIRPFARCPHCNTELKFVAKEEIYDRLELKTQLFYDDFRICLSCDQIYWKGSHVQRMEALFDEILEGGWRK